MVLVIETNRKPAIEKMASPNRVTVEEANKNLSSNARVKAFIKSVQDLRSLPEEELFSQKRLKVEEIMYVHAYKILTSNGMYQRNVGRELSLLEDNEATPKKLTIEYLKLISNNLLDKEKEGRSDWGKQRIDSKYRRIAKRLRID